MSFRSQAQERYFNANKGKLEKEGVNVNEWNQASKGLHLPEKVGTKHKTQNTMTRIAKPTHTDHQVAEKHKGHAMTHHKHVHHKMDVPHPFKHGSAHDATPMSQIVEHHMHKVSVAHSSHPHNKYFQMGKNNVRNAEGKTGTMHVPNA